MTTDNKIVARIVEAMVYWYHRAKKAEDALRTERTRNRKCTGL